MAGVKSWDIAVERGVVDLRPDLGAVQDELLELLSGLRREHWATPTMLPGWDVHAIALHLLGGDLGRLSGAYLGRPPGVERDFDDLASVIERGNEDWVRGARIVPPPMVVDFLRLTADRVTGLFAEADLWAPATAVAWTGTGPSPLWLDIAREYTERWVHQAQIREAVGAPLLADRRWLHPLLDTFVLALPRAYRHLVAAAGTTVVVSLTGDAGGDWRVWRGPERWHVATGTADDPAARVSIPADRAWRLLAGLITADDASAAISALGEPMLWRPAVEAVAVMTSR